MYLASARFEYKVQGLPEAMKHFFDSVQKNIGAEEALFFVERLSNINSTYRPSRVHHLADLVEERLSISVNRPKLIRLYEQLAQQDLLSEISTER